MTRTMMAMIMAAATMVAIGAGCGSPPSCETAVANAARLRELGEAEAAVGLARCKKEGWSGELRSCAAKAKTAGELERCAARPSRDSVGAYDSYMKKSKRSEADLQLRSLEKSLRMHYMETATFPAGEVGPTPAPGSCCAGPGHKCAPEPSLWNGVEVWDALDFEITEPSYYSFSYRSTRSTEAVVEAIGDLDCDSILATTTLRCEAENGEPRCTVIPPAAGAD